MRLPYNIENNENKTDHNHRNHRLPAGCRIYPGAAKSTKPAESTGAATRLNSVGTTGEKSSRDISRR